MSLAILTNLFPNPMEPGRSTFNEQLVLALGKETSVAIAIVPIDWKRSLKYLLSGGRRAIRQCDSWKGMPVCYPTHAYIPRFGRWLNGPLMVLSLLPTWFRLRREKLKTILAIWAFPEGFAAVVLGWLGGQRVVVRVIGSDVEIMADEPFRRVLTVWALNRSHRVLSVCAYLRERLIEHGVRGDLIDVIYEGIDRSRFFPRDKIMCRRQLNLNVDAKIVLFVGNLKFDKGPVDLLNALIPALRGTGNELYFLGDGPAKDTLIAITQSHGLSSVVHIMGRVQHDSIPIWLNAANVMCLPSYHEGIPNVIVEATACGVPCVATAVGGVPEVLSAANGYLVPLGDGGALLRAVEDSLAKTWSREDIQSAIVTGTWQETARSISHCIAMPN